MLELIYTSNKVASYPTPSPRSFLYYINDLDAMLLYVNNSLYKVFRDGTCIFIGNLPGSDDWFPISLDRGRIGYQKGDVFGVVDFYASDPIIFQPNATVNLIDESFVYPLINTGINHYLDLNKRLWIGWRGGGTYSPIFCYDINPPGTALWSIDPSAMYGSIYTSENQTVNYVGTDYIVVCGSSTYLGERSFGLFININTGKIERIVIMPYAKLVTYDYNNDIFMIIGTDNLIRIYANDRYPSSFGPVISEDYYLYEYKGSNIKVQLLSLGNFPCPNRLVSWSLPTSLGNLEKPVSETDEDGYAYNYYYGPPGNVGEKEVITVEWG